MIVCKGFPPGLTCRGYQFRMGLNITEKASCVHNGLHRAGDPLDCLHYYGDIDHAEYYIVDAGRDTDEDGVDSRISRIELTILKRLTERELLLHDLIFMTGHPKRKWNSNIKVGKAKAWNDYTAVRGADPIAKGTRNSDVFAFAKEDSTTGGIQQTMMAETDGKMLRPGI